MESLSREYNAIKKYILRDVRTVLQQNAKLKWHADKYR